MPGCQPSSRGMNLARLETVVKCDSPICKGGGVPVLAILHDAVRRGLASLDYVGYCEGLKFYGRRSHGDPCFARYEIRGWIVYKHDPGVGS